MSRIRPDFFAVWLVLTIHSLRQTRDRDVSARRQCGVVPRPGPRFRDRLVDIRGARYLAEHIPNAPLVELPGNDHLPWIGDQDAVLDAIEEFVTGTRHEPESIGCCRW